MTRKGWKAKGVAGRRTLLAAGATNAKGLRQGKRGGPNKKQVATIAGRRCWVPVAALSASWDSLRPVQFLRPGR